jgi:signal transduction histidine kinase
VACGVRRTPRTRRVECGTRHGRDHGTIGRARRSTYALAAKTKRWAVIAPEHIDWTFPADALRPALSLAMALEGADSGVLLLARDEPDLYYPALGAGRLADTYESLGIARLGAGPLGTLLAHGGRLVVAAEALSGDELAGLANTVGFRHLTIEPLRLADDTLAGALVLLFRDREPQPERATPMVGWCASLAAGLITSARERQRIALELESATAMGRARLQLLARMTHELRTPLQSIAGYLDLFSMGAADQLSARQKRLLERVQRSEQLLTSIIDDQITFARIEEGRVDYHLGPVLAAEALRTTAVVTSPLAARHGVTLYAGGCSPSLFVQADPDKLLQLLINLVTNALKFTPRGGTVRLSCATDGDGVAFSVTDDGPGIPVERIPSIFLPYVQLGNDAHDAPHGSGLGLAICREFAAGMRGELTVDSAPGAGATFTLRLPAAAAPSGAVPRRQRAHAT